MTGAILSTSPIPDRASITALGAWLQSPKRVIRLVALLILPVLLFLWSQLYFVSSGSAQNRSSPIRLPRESKSIQKHDYRWPQFASWKEDSWSFSPDVDSLGLQPIQHSTFLRSLQTYTSRGHNTISLAEIISPLKNKNADITFILPVSTLSSFNTQLEAALLQTIRPKSIWLVCSSVLRSDVESSIALKNSQVDIKVLTIDNAGNYPPGSAGQASWLQLLSSVQTDYAWVLDSSVKPSARYLESIYELMQIDEYTDGLLGTVGAVLPSNFNNDAETNILCLPAAYGDLPKVTQPVDLVHGAWLLRRTWLPFLTSDTRVDALAMPLSRYISQSLLAYANVPTVIVPLDPSGQSQLMTKEQATQNCNTIRGAYNQTDEDGWFRLRSLRTSPTALDYRQITIRQHKQKLHTALFVVDGSEQAVALHPLLCRYNFQIHVAVTGTHRGLSGTTLRYALDESGCTNVMVHDFDIAESDDLTAASTVSLATTRIIKVLRPRVLFYIQQDRPISRTLESVAQIHELAHIGLPAEDVRHALWIPDLPLDTLQYWNTISVSLVVITDRRPHSLSRLLQSASRSHFLGDKVNLVVHMEQSADRVTRMFINSFSWRHGDKTTRHRIRKGGLMPAIVESWYPSGDDDYAVLLEDDIEVSPMFYAWAKYSILKYRYSRTAKGSQTLYGISLYSPRNLELKPEGRRPFDPNDVLLVRNYPSRTPYVSQVPCSWGAVYFPEHWREFHEYITRRLEDAYGDQNMNITVPHSRSERWKKSWKKYYIELVYLRGYVMLYPNFQNFESFSTNHLELGTHVKKGRNDKVSDFLVPLMQKDTILTQLPGMRLPEYDELPALDLWGELKTLEELDRIGSAWHVKVSACERSPGRFDPHDLLCPFMRTAEEKEANAIPSPVKKPKLVKTIEIIEPLDYTTVYIDSSQPLEDLPDDLPQSIDVSQLTPGQADPSLADDRHADFEAGFSALDRLYDNTHSEDLNNLLQDEVFDILK